MANPIDPRNMPTYRPPCLTSDLKNLRVLQETDDEDETNIIPITPKPGYCCVMKFKANNERVYLNYCPSEKVPMLLDNTFAAGTIFADEMLMPLIISEPHLYTNNKKELFCTFDIILNAGFFDDVLIRNLRARNDISFYALEGILDEFKVSITPDDMYYLDIPYFGILTVEYMGYSPRSGVYYEELASKIMEEYDARKPTVKTESKNEENPPHTRSFPARRETMVETVRSIAEKLLSPSILESFRASSGRATLPIFTNITRVPDDLPPNPSNRPTNIARQPIQVSDSSRYIPPANSTDGPRGTPFDLDTALAVIHSDDVENDTPNMAILRNILRRPSSMNNPVVISLLNHPYLTGRVNRPQAKPLQTFSFHRNPVADGSIPITMAPCSNGQLYALIEGPPMPRLSPALEIQPIQKITAEKRLEDLMNGASNFVALKNMYELYDVGDCYLFLTVSSQDYSNVDVFANVDRLIVFRKGIYYRDVYLPKPVINQKARANFFNGILMIVLPIHPEYH